MSNTANLSDELARVADLVKAGDLNAAKWRTSAALDAADPAALSIVAQCAATLRNYPHAVALAKLRNAWKRTTNAEHRALIALCAPAEDTGQYRPGAEPATPHRYGRGNYRAPRDNDQRIDPNRRTYRREHPREEEPRVVIEYTDARAGVDDAPETSTRPDGYTLDYDKAAVADLRGMPCVSCWLERSVADAAGNRVGTEAGDDGLCGDCREAGRPGIPELPAGHTRADAVAARCAFITEHTGSGARSILRWEWKRADPQDRDLITAWVCSHPVPEEPEVIVVNGARLCSTCDANINALPKGTRYCSRTCALAAGEPSPAHQDTDADLTGCAQCGGSRQLRHGLCLDCRKLDADAGPVSTAEHHPPLAA